MPYNTVVVGGLIRFISKELDKNEQKIITDWINKNILIPSSKLDFKQAFVKAQKIIFAEYIAQGNIASIKSFMNAVNACENKKLKKLVCEILSDVCLEQKRFLSTNTKLYQELTKILDFQYDSIQDSDLKRSVVGKIIEVSQIVQEANICKTRDPEAIKKQKWYINNFIEKLFKIDMSQDVLVDIVINDDPNNPCDNQTTIVGRPKVLGSSTKQMRHVTPYSFIEHAITEMIMQVKSDARNKTYINDIMEAIKPLLKNKQGICLTADQYSKVVSNITPQNEESERFKLSTTSNEYYLIYNEKFIEQFEKCKDFSQDEKDKAKGDFSTKFEKYITYGIKYLIEEILDLKDVNTVTIVCEGIARIILTLFNQEKYAAFPEEGNSVKDEIRVYQSSSDAEKPQNKEYEVYSHAEITKKLNDQTWISQYDQCIRIVDNEGATVKKVAKVLKIISLLVKRELTSISHKTEKEDEKYQKEYNEKYNFKVNEQNLKCQDKYNEEIDIKSNLMDMFQYHIAKHLYSVFDFKPLEQKVLVPKQQVGNEIITVYPSASGKKTAEYSVQDGKQYRELQYNSRKGYNDDAIFRMEMSNEDTINALKNKVVNHIIISLLPFRELEIGCMFDKAQCERATILQAFCELVKVRYATESMIQLDDKWIDEIQNECSRYFEDLLGESEIIEDNYNL
ncbi:hypothetical protein [Rickettsia asembonensis]|uniref:Uncharacterized protein n=1 Tax=Rickettsia asembonensis TaxID=1068590 RepID=A0A0C2QY55_9RICK|nr:hypothetical protein [Rickettsia asembonensis]KIJ88784.1 hypothetical protein SB78_03670 [Rickettsia asembonensis]